MPRLRIRLINAVKASASALLSTPHTFKFYFARILTRKKLMTTLIMANGGGTNSTALLIGLEAEQRRPDIITFADTGGEKPGTYAHIDIMQEWCARVGFPEITILKGAYPQQKIDGGLYEECMRLGVLPSRVYGMGGCSMKWKRAPQDKFTNAHPLVVADHAAGRKPIKLIGYDADEQRRAGRESFKNDAKYAYEFPLMDWGWTRDDCIQAIDDAGIARPGKSACWFCPSSRKTEVRELAVTHPDLMAKAIAMEVNAAPKLRDIAGLGRQYSWGDLVATDDMFPESYALTEMPCGCFDGDE
jgi:hypothetical protein